MGMRVELQKTIPETFLTISQNSPTSIVYRIPESAPANHTTARQWRSVPFSEVRAKVARLTNFLLGESLEQGERVAIISQTRPEWMESDLAILGAGGVSVSIYPSLTPHEIGYILYDAKASVVIAENQEQVDKLLKIDNTPFQIPGTEESQPTTVTLKLRRIIAIEPCHPHALIIQLDSLINPEGPATFARVDNIKPLDVASLVYTSGTTGAPKGVIQTHNNHLSNIRQAFNAQMYSGHSQLMLFLPLAHSFAKLMGYIGFLTTATISFPAITDHTTSKFDPSAVTKDIREANAEIIPVVPRILEKMHSGILERTKHPGLAGMLLRLTIQSCERRSAALDAGKPVGLMDNLIFRLTAGIRKQVKEKLFGAKFQYAISGGAKLPVDIAEFFDALEIEVLEGYGLTETCVATNVNRLGKKRIGSVGPVLDADIEMKIASDGEIMFRGPNIALGYWNRPTATQSSWSQDGWFATGDLGRIDSDGYLWIMGRKKELIITSGGKKIAPEPIEQRIKECECVSQAMLVGDGKPYCAALITLNEPLVRAWAARAGVVLAEPIHNNEKLKQHIWQHIESVNRELASFESIKKITVLGEDFTQENTLLTPTFKVRRNEISKRYASEIEQLFKI